MNRYDISSDFKKKFVEENKSVWSKSIKPVYFSINGEQAKASSNPYSMEQAGHGLVVFPYVYTVISQKDSSLVPLFFCKPKGRFFRSAFSYLIEKQTYTTHLICKKCAKAE